VENTRAGSALIVAGGNPIKEAVLDHLKAYSWVVAADSGLDQAIRLGIRPDLVVGDMDSVSPAALEHAINQGIAIERHPRAKDATDLELAIDAAALRGFATATIIGGTGGRMAHTLANALVLTRRRDIHLGWLTSKAQIAAMRSGSSRDYPATYGTLLSVLAVGESADCTSVGLLWPLDGNPLTVGSTRGISNEVIESSASVSVHSGLVLTVHERT
jgi:thiamine pyrophosphokinase